MNDLHDLLARRHRAQHFRADGALAHLGDEILGDGQCNVSLEQRNAHFPQGFIDVFFLEGAPTAKALKDCT